MIGAMRRDILIAPSILSADFLRLGETLAMVEEAGADWVHIDVMDGHFVPNLTMGPFIVEACRKATRLPLDVHLMVAAPDRLIPAFLNAGSDVLTVHVEACSDLYRTLESIRHGGARAGVSLNPGTPVASIADVVPLLDLVLVMAVSPGYAGQAHIPGSADKVGRVRALLDAAASSARLEVDGGITASTAPGVVQAGADVLVAAKAIFQHPDGAAAGIRSLRQASA
jgi:ribulose-phosphate 3-epimerase